MTFDLPMPPSVNHYWRHSRAGVYLSETGRKYRAEVLKVCKSPIVLFPNQRLAVTVTLYPKTRGKFDLDNKMKGLLDALEKAGVYADDAQIDRLIICRGGVRDKAGCVVHVEVMRDVSGC